MPILDAIRKRWPWIKHFFADGAYDRRKLLDKATFLDFIVEIVRRPDNDPGFKVIPSRWVVERSIGWLTPIPSPRPRLRTTHRRLRGHDLPRHGKSPRPKNQPSLTFSNRLYDGTGFLWDIQQNGSINDGSSDAYDGGLRLVGFPSLATAETEDNGREIVIGSSQIDGLDVSRKIYVPEDQGWARFLEVFTNNTSATISCTVQLSTNLGSNG